MARFEIAGHDNRILRERGAGREEEEGRGGGKDQSSLAVELARPDDVYPRGDSSRGATVIWSGGEYVWRERERQSHEEKEEEEEKDKSRESRASRGGGEQAEKGAKKKKGGEEDRQKKGGISREKDRLERDQRWKEKGSRVGRWD